MTRRGNYVLVNSRIRALNFSLTVCFSSGLKSPPFIMSSYSLDLRGHVSTQVVGEEDPAHSSAASSLAVSLSSTAYVVPCDSNAVSYSSLASTKSCCSRFTASVTFGVSLSSRREVWNLVKVPRESDDRKSVRDDDDNFGDGAAESGSVDGSPSAEEDRLR